MHILFITDNFPPETNAPASRTFDHAREWVKIGHKVSVITCVPNFPYGQVFDGFRNKAFQYEVMDNIDVYRVWSYMAANKGFAKRTLDFISFMLSSIVWSPRAQRPDIVIATSPQFFAGIAGYVISKIKRCPFVLEIRDLWPEQVATLGLISEKNIIYRLFSNFAGYLYRHCDKLVTVGEGYQEQIITNYNISKEHISVIPNGISPDIFKKHGMREKFRKEMCWNNKFVVLYLGTIGMSQKLETILKAADRLREVKDIYFVFVGEGAEKQKLLRMKKERNLENCDFLPMQPKEKVPSFYEAADVCVVPLRHCQLFLGNYPSKMFEAMGMECPIILSAEGKSAELLAKANAGISVEPENSDKLAETIEKFYTDPDLCKSKGQNGREFVITNFTRSYWAEQYMLLLEEQIK